MKRYLSRSCAVLLFTAFLFAFTSCKVGRYVYYNFANITDYKIFPYRTAKNDSVQFHFAHTANPKGPKKLTLKGKDITFDDFLEKSKTVAFLIIKNDTLQYEKYFNRYDESSIVASFSMAKSITSILIGCAINDGLINSVDDPVINYIPELANKGMDKITIKNLLQMTSGVKFHESYVNPFADDATYYYGKDLKKAIFKRKPEYEPGTVFSYSSGDSQMLGLVLERALKGKSITDYLEEKLWKPLGMEYDATWSLDDKGGLEKTFCCLNARARDFAKLGRLYLKKGNWNGRQIVSREWVEASTRPDPTEGVNYYKYQWWLPTPNGDFMAEGILGQYIYVNPDKNLIIVRLGKKEGGVDWQDIFVSLAQHY